MLEYTVENEDLWEMIKDGKINGLSLEGIFQYDQEGQINEIINSIKVDNDDLLEKKFDEILFQISKGNEQEKIEENYFYSEFEILKEWKSKFGYKFNIYSNDHFINGKPHFHFDNKQDDLYCKISFEGEIFEIMNNKKIPKNILKELNFFLSKLENKKILIEMWNNKNPSLVVK